MTAALPDGVILVTGGAGFLGRSLVRRLRRSGRVVRPVDDLSAPPLDGCPQGLLHKPVQHLTDEDLRNVVCICHLAARKSVPESFSDPLRVIRDIEAAHHLFELAKRSGVPRVVIASSCEVYGSADTVPTAEDVAVRPRSAYASAKAAIEMIAAIHRQAGHSEVSVVRLFNVFGPGERPDALIPAFCRSAIVSGQLRIEGSGHQRRDLSFVSVTIDRLARLCVMPAPPPVINCGSGRSYSVLEVAAIVEALVPHLERRFGEPRPLEIEEFRADMALSRRTFGPEDDVPVDVGVKETLDWWRCVLD